MHDSTIDNYAFQNRLYPLCLRIEPPHDKTNKMIVRPAKTQISLGIRPVWSESSLCAQWVAKDPVFLHADSEDWSDWADAQADLSLRWAHTHFVGFVMLRLIFSCTAETPAILVHQQNPGTHPTLRGRCKRKNVTHFLPYPRPSPMSRGAAMVTTGA